MDNNSPQPIESMNISVSSPLQPQMQPETDSNIIRIQRIEASEDQWAEWFGSTSSDSSPSSPSQLPGNENIQRIQSIGNEPGEMDNDTSQSPSSRLLQPEESIGNEPTEMDNDNDNDNDNNNIYQQIEVMGNALFQFIQSNNRNSAPMPPMRLQMDGQEIVLNVGSASSSTPSSPAPQQAPRDVTNASTSASTANHDPNWRAALFEAVNLGNWEKVEEIADQHKEATTTPLSLKFERLLMIAIKEGREMAFINKLVNMMEIEDLILADISGQTALHVAVLVGNISIAKLLVGKNNDLPNIRRSNNFLPIHLAAAGGQRDMTFYLHTVTKLEEEFNPDKEPANTDLIQCAVSAGMFDFALDVLQQDIKLSWKQTSPLGVLAEEPSSFPSGNQFNFLESFIYSCIPMKYSAELIKNLVEEELAKSSNDAIIEVEKSRVYEMLHKVFGYVLHKLVKPMKDIRKAKLKHVLVFELIKKVCIEIKNLDAASATRVLTGPFLLAVQNDIHEIVEEILQVFPHAIKYMDESNHTAVHFAAAYRREKIFDILYNKSGSLKLALLNAFDDDDNSILHLVAYKPHQNQMDTRSGAVLQMQSELQWYKGMEKLVMPQLRTMRNKKGKTPLMIFDEEHKDIITTEGQWMIGMANSCIVGASLIAAVVFAAAITVPGGNNSNGLPTFSSVEAFKVFAFSDALALVCSITTVLIFLSIFTARYSVNDHIYALPNRLIIGLVTLFLSVTFMMIAFSAIINIVVAEEDWIIIPTGVLASVPVMFFGYLQLPSLLKVIKSTYGPSKFKYTDQ